MRGEDAPVATEQLRARIVDGNHSTAIPVTNRLPFPYHWIPGDLRLILARVIYRSTLKNLRSQQRAPDTYADNDTDLLAGQLVSAGDRGPFWGWPGDRRCALVVSHDVDTPGQRGGVEALRRVDEAHGLRGTFNFVGSDLGHYRSLIKELKAAGHEIGLHDLVHDNRIAFLSADQVVARLAPLRDQLDEFEIRGFRSPSWYTSGTLWQGLHRLGFSYDMSALDTWSFFSPDRNFGLASFFPAVVDDLVVVPNTIPFEVPWYFGLPRGQALAFWQPKLDAIASNGGLIMINAHPDPWWCGRPEALLSYGHCLTAAIRDHRPACVTAGEVADHARRQVSQGATLHLAGSPPVQIPRHRPGSLLTARTLFNPMRPAPVADAVFAAGYSR